MRRLLAALCLSAAPAFAGEADVVDVRYVQASDGTYTFDVTVRHADAGPDHFADRWEIVGPDGAVIATRILAHPHVEEQPFTRGLAGVEIDEDVEEVTVRAHDGLHGFGGVEMTVEMKGRL